MTYPLTFITDRFIPDNLAGCMRVFLLPVVFIRPKYKDDIGLYQHELTHVKQAFRFIFPPLYGLLYMLSKAFRLRCEVEAYKVQAEYNPEHIELYAEFISKNYSLDVSVEEASLLLRN
jgi:hypothetical protein